MTTKEEEAKELISKFTFKKVDGTIVRFDRAKQCALICVDEKIETLLPYAGLLDIKKQVQELEEVKQEIKKL